MVGSSRTVRRRALMGALLAGTVVAACAPMETSEPADEGGQAADGDTDVEEEGAEQELDEDATLRYGATIDASRLDPHRASSSTDNVWLWPVYDRLVHISPDGEAVPGLAEEWEFSDDGTELTLQLREGVTFHDGEPFDGDAVAANIERGQTVEGSAVAAQLGIVEQVEVVDEHEVVFHLAQPDASLPLVLSDRPGAMASPAAFEEDLDNQPVGAGMYEVVEHSPDHQVVFERYDDYWEPEAAAVARLEMTVMPDDATRLNALRGGQIDLASIEPRQIDEAEQQGLVVDVVQTLQLGTMQLNPENRPEFADPLVRRALHHAIDREGIAGGVFADEVTPTVQPFPPDYFATDPDVAHDLFPHDPERARELLEEAGYPDGFSFELYTVTIPSQLQVVEVLADQLGEVGLDVSIRQFEGIVMIDRFYGEQDGDAMFMTWGGRPDPSMTIDLLYTSESFANPSGLTSDEIENLHAEAVATVDEDERARLLRELSALVAEDSQSLVPVYNAVNVAAANEDVVGLEPWIFVREFRGLGMAAD